MKSMMDVTRHLTRAPSSISTVPHTDDSDILPSNQSKGNLYLPRWQNWYPWIRPVLRLPPQRLSFSWLHHLLDSVCGLEPLLDRVILNVRPVNGISFFSSRISCLLDTPNHISPSTSKFHCGWLYLFTVFVGSSLSNMTTTTPSVYRTYGLSGISSHALCVVMITPRYPV
jgi:hypothetical protein